MNKKGEVILLSEYDRISEFKQNYGIAEIGEKYEVIDAKGDIVLPFKYEYINLCDNGTLVFKEEGEYYLGDIEGNRLMDIRVF